MGAGNCWRTALYLVYSRFSADIARNNHTIFFHHQRADGYIPCWARQSHIGAAQIQMVVPIAATALETAELLGDEAFLAQAYAACTKWDDWLMANRNTRGTGLCEAFCEFATGHDNSPRFHGVPKKCPNEDAELVGRGLSSTNRLAHPLLVFALWQESRPPPPHGAMGAGDS